MICYVLIASIAQLAERALRKRTVVGSIPTGGFALEDVQQFDFKNDFRCKYGIQIWRSNSFIMTLRNCWAAGKEYKVDREALAGD